jgi:hypothetical protein
MIVFGEIIMPKFYSWLAKHETITTVVGLILGFFIMIGFLLLILIIAIIVFAILGIELPTAT